MTLAKIHKICTLIALCTTTIMMSVIFIAAVDQTFHLNILTSSIEQLAYLLATAFGILSVAGTLTSAMLSLYRLAEKN